MFPVLVPVDCVVGGMVARESGGDTLYVLWRLWCRCEWEEGAWLVEEGVWWVGGLVWWLGTVEEEGESLEVWFEEGVW